MIPSPGSRRLWWALLPVGLLLLLAVGVVRKKGGEVPSQPPRSDRSGPGPGSPPDSAALAGGARFHPEAGTTLTYALKGRMDVRYSLSFGKTPMPLRVTFDDVESLFSLSVLDRVGDGSLVSLVPRGFRGRVSIEGGGAPVSRTLDGAVSEGKAAAWSSSALFVVAPTGSLREILVDERFTSPEWARDRYPEYLESVLSIVSLFPPLAAVDGTPEGYSWDLDLFDQIRLEEVFAWQSEGVSGLRGRGRPRKLTRFLGAPIEPGQDFPGGGGSSIGGSVMTVDPAIGYFSRIEHRLTLGTDETFTRIEVSLHLAEALPAPPPLPFDRSSLKGRVSFGSLDALRQALALLQRRSGPENARHPGRTGDLTLLLKDLNSLFSPNPDPGLGDESDLEDRLEELLGSNPDLVGELPLLARNLHLSDPALLVLVDALSAKDVKGLRGADTAAVSIVKDLRGEPTLLSALVKLQSLAASSSVTDFFLTYAPESSLLQQARDASLAASMKELLGRNDVPGVRRMMEALSSRLEGPSAITPALLAVFSPASDVLDSAIAEKWANGEDRSAQLKLMLLRSQGDSGKAQEFKETVRANVFGTFSDAQVLTDLVPIAAGTRNAEFLEFLRDNSASALVRSNAAFQLSRLKPR